MRGSRTTRFEDREFLSQSSWEHEPSTQDQLPAQRPSTGRMVSLDSGLHEWLVEGRMPRIGTSILVGAKGVGKSTLARDLALRVARGRPWLDFPTQQGPVLYVYLEGDRKQVRAAFAKLGLSADDNLHFVDTLQMSELRERIRERAKALQPSLVVIDGLVQLLHAEALNDRGMGTSALDRVLDLSQEISSHVLLVHDLAGALAREMSSLLGSTERRVDTIFMLTRIRDERLLRSIQQKGRALLTPIRIPAHGAPSPPEPRRRRTRSRQEEHPELRREILAYLRLSSRLATQREISEFVQETSPEAIFATLGEMCREELLIRVGSGEQGDPYRYTGCDVVRAPARAPWLRRVRPWARVAPIRLTTANRHL